MKSKNLKKAIALGLATATLMPTAAFAKEFKDVTKSNNYSWAYNEIDVLSDKGVIAGYEDGTFKPERPVSLEEVLQLLYQVISPSTTEVKEAVEKYGNTVKENGVRDWAKDAVSVALARGIISESVLKGAKENGFFDSKDQKFPVRADIAVFFAKGLNLSNSGDETLLKHKDKDKLNSTTRGYLASLVKEGIFSSTGSDGNFQGDRYIRRAEMAIITKAGFDYAAKNGIDAKTEKLTGKVILASKLNGTNVIIIESGNNKYSFAIDSTTKYKIADKDAKFEDISQGQEVEIEYTKLNNNEKFGTAKVVNIKNANLELVGYVNSLDKNKEEITIRYRNNDKDLDFRTTSKISTSDTKTFKLAKNAKIEAFGNTLKLEDIKNDDLLEFKTDGKNEINEIKVFPKDAVVNGEVVYLNNIDRTNGIIRLKLKDNKNYEFYTTNDSRDLGGLRIGDNVNIKTTYKVALGLATKDERNTTVAGKVISSYDGSSFGYNNRASYIEIRKPDGTRQSYDYSDRPSFGYEGGANYSYALRESNLRDKFVKLELDSRGEVTKVTILDKSSQFTATIQVTYSEYDRGNFYGHRDYESSATVIQSNNEKVRLGSTIKISSANSIDRYTVLRISGLVDRNGKISYIFEEPRELGKSDRLLNYDNRYISRDRDFITSSDLENTNYKVYF